MIHFNVSSLTCAGEDVVEGAVDGREDGAGAAQVRQRVRQVARLDGLVAAHYTHQPSPDRV